MSASVLSNPGSFLLARLPKSAYPTMVMPNQSVGCPLSDALSGIPSIISTAPSAAPSVMPSRAQAKPLQRQDQSMYIFLDAKLSAKWCKSMHTIFLRECW